jgi:hypothetical protein
LAGVRRADRPDRSVFGSATILVPGLGVFSHFLGLFTALLGM